MSASDLERAFMYWIKIKGLPIPVPEYVFAPPRKWRFDFAYPEKKVAVELEGGCWVQGAHVRGTGFVKDCEKYNTAALLGWRVLRFTDRDLNRGEAADVVQRILGAQQDPLQAERARREAFKTI